ncbi:beta-1,2-xylosyltransferase RCN11-like [Bradysia coprophila]|uniref:beta-1,2-xylosyltransferase RCN11-like n=1 Tax=Bradysia coprophila TaxID=38358 RepID=UPI00187D8E61|nr:beta-1,2-xylosyltransferase RCN11-like [Bradysia coprophila]
MRHEGPPRNDVNGNSNDCDEKYGPEMFEIWKATAFETCTNESTSKITCYLRYDEAVTRRMCLLSNTKIRLYEPYYVASTSNLSSEATIKMQNDILAADCAPFERNYNGIDERKMQFDSFFHVDKFEASRNGDLQCNHTVLHTVFWMWRWDATNAYHFLEDVTNTFASLALLDEDPDQVEIAIYDGMQGIVNNPLFTFWSELFPKGVRIIRNNPFPSDTCFRRSITNMYGMRSHFTEFGGYKTDAFCSSPILKGFRDWATDKMHFKRTNHVKRFTLLFVSRQQYLSTRKIARVLVNEDTILETIRSAFPLLNVIRFRPENYTTFKEQVQIAVKANIMVGVHGAGLVYSRFMSPGSHLIEVFMDDRSSANRHFHNIATWVDLRHHAIEFMGKVLPPEDIVKVIGNAMKELDRKTTAG